MKTQIGITAIWGRRKVGKTLAGLNSPYQPVHIIDVENSSYDYFEHQNRLIELGYFPQKFTRAECLTYKDFLREASRIIYSKELHYGTIVLDTVGQISEWIKTAEFTAAGANAEKLSQVIWGKVRDRLRNLLLQLQAHADLIILTAHESNFKDVYSPRANPAILELASMSLRLTREANTKLPDAIVDVARLPFFPPRISQFTLNKLLEYIQRPANWDNLSEDEKQKAEPVPAVESEDETA